MQVRAPVANPVLLNLGTGDNHPTLDASSVPAALAFAQSGCTASQVQSVRCRVYPGVSCKVFSPNVVSVTGRCHAVPALNLMYVNSQCGAGGVTGALNI
jgi:hypothetical protein